MGGGGQTANISNAAEFQVSVQFLQIHDFSEKQTLPKDYLIKDVDYTNFLRIVVWFIKNQILSECHPLPLPPLISTRFLLPTDFSSLAPILFPLFFCLSPSSFLQISLPSLPLLFLMSSLILCPIPHIFPFLILLLLSSFASVYTCVSLVPLTF